MCGLYGLIDCSGKLSKRQKSSLLHALATAAEQRGTDASGIAYFSSGQLSIRKRAVPAHRLRVCVPEGVAAVIGHTRMTTQGDARFNRNNHPFAGCVNGKHFALAHNGVLYNDDILRDKHQLPRTAIETDSYVAVQLIEKEKALSFDSLKAMVEELSGTFTFTVLDEAGIWFVKGDNPLCLWYFPHMGIYVYASTELILEHALARTGFSLGKAQDVAVDMGEILHITTAGDLTRSTFSTANMLPGRSFHLYDPGGWGDEDTSYLSDLRYMACYFGYSPNMVDRLLAKGYTTDEIEEVLYSVSARR